MRPATPFAAMARDRSAAALMGFGLIAKLPNSMLSLAIVLAVAGTQGQAVAGGTVTALALGVAVSSPRRGRLVDRFGPRPTLIALAAGQSSALVALWFALVGGLPVAAVIAVAGLAGIATPPVVPVLRSVWRRLASDASLSIAGQAWESISMDIAYVVAPSMVALGAGLVAPVHLLLGLAALRLATTAAIAGPAGRAWAAAGRAAGGAVADGTPADRSPSAPLPRPVIRSVLAAGCAPAGLTAAELGVVSIAASAGQPALAGVLVALMSVGSILGGLAYGHRHPAGSLRGHLALAALAWGTGCGLAAATVAELPVVAAALAVGGVGIAVMFTAQFELAGRHAPAQRTTEVYAWMATAGQLGTAVAALIAGTLGGPAALVLAGLWPMLGALTAPPDPAVRRVERTAPVVTSPPAP
jgi:hypothetical protein